MRVSGVEGGGGCSVRPDAKVSECVSVRVSECPRRGQGENSKSSVTQVSSAREQTSTDQLDTKALRREPIFRSNQCHRPTQCLYILKASRNRNGKKKLFFGFYENTSGDPGKDG